MSIFENIIPSHEQDALFCQQAKVAQLRALLGRKDAALRDIRDHAPPDTPAHDIAVQALAIQLEDAA